MAKTVPHLSRDQIAAILKTAWDDLPPYNKVLMEHGLGQGQLVQLMKRELTGSAYKLWAARGKSSKAPTSKATWPHGR
ncbi:DUF2805 domain-containing protein [Roseateles sp. DAIF2]|uniref:DUF2805 domain-containing protein n=1 Tax=Roseateles sp. DAIF2 TaxID=2714952 RepID=UPI0018A2C36D|nr:DUF2805 domain-containing protein [Roseateles sp. DAIF2]QPF76337.1 DUF2805 domain-containing protein [Roseateles sp. DAIF2]